jgi:hypothetical protein
MFESVTFSRASMSDLTSLGDFAECLLYYRRVHAVVDHGSFTRLARICGPETLIGLIEDGHLSMTYLENRPAVASQVVGGRNQHGFVLVQGQGKESQNLVPQLFQDLTGKQGRGRRLARRLLNRLSSKTYVPDDLAPSLGMVEDTGYTDRLVPQILVALGVVRLPDAPQFRIYRENGAFFIDTNLDFAALNAEYRCNHADHNLDPAFLLDLLYEGHAEVDFAASRSTEMVPAPAESVIAKERVLSLLEASSRSLDRLTAFKSLVLSHNGSVADAINSGIRTFEDLRKLLGAADRFKQWIHGQPPEGDLVKSYLEDVTSVSWRTGSATKNLRFILFNGAQVAAGAAIAGPVGALAGVGLAAADTYLLDRLLTGWKPHQFVRGPLQQFLDGSN